MSTPLTHSRQAVIRDKYLPPHRHGAALCLSGVGYSKDFATQVIAAIRTDMDRFSDDEISVLENHGYTLADRPTGRTSLRRARRSALEED